jgi:hypothetical protein
MHETRNNTGFSPLYQFKTKCLQRRSALSLLVSAILADDPDHTLATDNFAITANAFY